MTPTTPLQPHLKICGVATPKPPGLTPLSNNRQYTSRDYPLFEGESIEGNQQLCKCVQSVNYTVNKCTENGSLVLHNKQLDIRYQ